MGDVARRRIGPAPAAAAHRPTEPRTAFVLSGGASLGALHVGMLHALYERGIQPDLLVGTSAGALNAAFIVSRPQTPATAMQLGRIWRGLHREDVFPVSMGALVGGVRGRRDHVIPEHGLGRLVSRYIEFDDLADTLIPLYVVTFDVTEGRELLLSSGPAVDAIAAAASIPGVFPPVRVDDRQLIDGGVVNDTPISHAVELGAERVYVLPTQDPAATPVHVVRGALDAAVYGLGLLVGSRLKADIARYSREAELIVLPAPNTSGVQRTSFGQSSRLMSEALAAARDRLAPRGVGGHLRLVT